MANKFAVIGSINMDLNIKMDEIPGIGETVLGDEIVRIPGGKGANQAVALSRLGNDVVFIGKVGNDDYADISLNSLEESGVDISRIGREDKNTGLAIINIDRQGNNNIIVIDGANGQVDKAFVRENQDKIKKTDALLFQFEIPMEAIEEGLKIGKENKILTVVNPAPALKIDDDLLSMIDIIIPNEHELERISGLDVSDKSSLEKASKELLDKGVDKVIVTLGDKGVFYQDSNISKHFESYNVDVVDTTAAGDSFIGGFLSKYVETEDIDLAIEYGQKTAALAIQRLGAQSSIPTKEELLNFY